MQSRAGMIGGTLTIERNAAGGTTVFCSAPNQSTPDKTESGHAQ
jgi:nitrate/nitrite-specific signal transduction histidine kinase